MLFVLPLLAIYEAGVWLLGGANPQSVRNGADNWLRVGLSRVGLPYAWLPPVVLLLVLLLWSVRRRHWTAPGELVSVLSGMVLESVAFALGLWGISRGLAPLLQRLGIELTLQPASEQALRQVITYLGAGIYEETLFRLLLFTALERLLRKMDLGGPLGLSLAALGSAILFSAAHHLGPYGQPYSNYLFLFRVVAGLYFAVLYRLRGFGIAVGAHACYNVMVSVGIS
jgi:membrane protease YdiL (CAAX protease family)